MNVLYLGPASPVLDYLKKAHAVRHTESEVVDADADWVVSYGYRYILPAEFCEKFDGRAVNLHIGLLPWNRGAHPNVWSVLDGTPSGVTLHYIDAGIDTGDIIAQQEVRFGYSVTLKDSYESLKRYAEGLFYKSWPSVVAGTAPRTKQPHIGTYHKAADLPKDIDWESPRGMLCGNVFA